MLSIIAAIANNNVIGKDNKLIWHLPEDLKRFKELTTGHTIIMGRKTFESLGRILPNRKHVVLCKSGKLVIPEIQRIQDKNTEMEQKVNIDNKKNITENMENVIIINNIEDLKPYIESKEENFVIGGASIYEQLMPYATKMYITKIEHNFEGDRYFPEIKENEWHIVSVEKGLKNEKNPYNYEYITYVRDGEELPYLG